MLRLQGWPVLPRRRLPFQGGLPTHLLQVCWNALIMMISCLIYSLVSCHSGEFFTTRFLASPCIPLWLYYWISVAWYPAFKRTHTFVYWWFCVPFSFLCFWFIPCHKYTFWPCCCFLENYGGLVLISIARGHCWRPCLFRSGASLSACCSCHFVWYIRYIGTKTEIQDQSGYFTILRQYPP